MWFGIGLQILYELDDRWRSCDVTSISKMVAAASQIYFRYQFWRRIAFKNVTSKSIRIPNLAKIAQSAAEILLFPVFENKRPPYWNSTSGSTLTFPSSSACDSRSVYHILSKSDHRRPSYDILAIIKMAATASEIYFRFRFGDISQLRTSKSICALNFDNVTQSLAEILLFQVSENKRPPYWNSTSGFHFDVPVIISMWFCVGTPTFMQIGPSAAELWRLSDFQDGARQPCWICCRIMVVMHCTTYVHHIRLRPLNSPMHYLFIIISV